MIKLLLADSLSQKTLELLREIPEFEIRSKPGLDREQLRLELRETDALVIRGACLDRELLQEATNLKLIVRAGNDTDHIDSEFALSRNIEVRNTPHAASVTVAEYTLAQMLNISRFLSPSYCSMKNRHWRRELFSGGMELYKKTAGVIGFGCIGQEVAKREIALGMHVVYTDILKIKNSIGARQVSLEELLRISDFISLHAPLNPSTRHLLSTPQFQAMKDGVTLILTVRSGVVDEQALRQALNTDKIRAVAMDIRENEANNLWDLIAHPKVYPTPFLGGATVEGEERAGEDVLSVLKEFFNV